MERRHIVRRIAIGYAIAATVATLSFLVMIYTIGKRWEVDLAIAVVVALGGIVVATLRGFSTIVAHFLDDD